MGYTYNGPYNETGALDSVQTSNGSYAILAYTRESINSERSYWLLGIDAKGAIEWNETIPLSKNDYLSSITTTSDRGFVLAGNYNSSNCLVKTDTLGNIEWVKPLGKLNGASVQSLVQTANGFVVAGSADGSRNESRIVWVMSTDDSGNAPQNFSTPPLSALGTNDSLLSTKPISALALVVVIGTAVISLLIYRRYHLQVKKV